MDMGYVSYEQERLTPGTLLCIVRFDAWISTAVHGPSIMGIGSAAPLKATMTYSAEQYFCY